MKIMHSLRSVFFAQFILAVTIAVMIYSGLWQASSQYLYEFIGVITASMVTTGGLYKMREIT